MKASTSSWGRFEMKPTVSVKSTVSPPGSWRWRVRGSSVTKRRFSVDHVGVGHGVEHRGLAGVGVAHEGHLAVAPPVAALALDVARAVDLLELAANVVDALDEAAPVDLELGLARPAGADADRPAGTASRRRGAVAAAGTRAAPARPGRGPRGCARSGRRCRGSPRCGRSRCARGSSRGCAAGPARARARRRPCRRRPRGTVSRSSSTLPEPRNVAGVGRVAALDDPREHVGAGGVDQQRQLVELVLEVLGGDAREQDAHEHDPLADRAVDECGGKIGHGAFQSMSATKCTGPDRVASPSASWTLRAPPGVVDHDVAAHAPRVAQNSGGRARTGAARQGPTDAALDHGHRRRGPRRPRARTPRSCRPPRR